jgi:hypothetical protein
VCLSYNHILSDHSQEIRGRSLGPAGVRSRAAALGLDTSVDPTSTAAAPAAATTATMCGCRFGWSGSGPLELRCVGGGCDRCGWACVACCHCCWCCCLGEEAMIDGFIRGATPPPMR